MKLKYLHNSGIFREQWDNCVRSTVDSDITGYSWYLDCVSPDWGGLVLGDYLAVMPLPVKRHYGFGKLYSPAFFEDCKIYSESPPDLELYRSFARIIYELFRFADFKMIQPIENKRFISEKDSFFELDLIRNSVFVRLQLPEDTRENLRIAEQTYDYHKGLMPNLLINEILLSGSNMSKQTETDLRRLLSVLLRRGFGKIYSLFDDKNRPAAVICASKGISKRMRVFYAWHRPDEDANVVFAGLLYHVLQEYSEKELSMQVADYMRVIPKSLLLDFGAVPYRLFRIRNKKKTIFGEFIRNYFT